MYVDTLIHSTNEVPRAGNLAMRETDTAFTLRELTFCRGRRRDSKHLAKIKHRGL